MGTANTLYVSIPVLSPNPANISCDDFRAMHSVVPADVKYSWSNTTRSTMKLDKKYLESEDDSKIDYGANAQTMFVVVNKDSVNKFGEERGYRISPSEYTAVHCLPRRC